MRPPCSCPRTSRPWRAAAAGCAVLLLGALAPPACTGQVGDSRPPQSAPRTDPRKPADPAPAPPVSHMAPTPNCPAGTMVSVEPGAVRRLNRREYGATVRDLLA